MGCEDTSSADALRTSCDRSVCWDDYDQGVTEEEGERQRSVNAIALEPVISSPSFRPFAHSPCMSVATCAQYYAPTRNDQRTFERLSRDSIEKILVGYFIF